MERVLTLPDRLIIAKGQHDGPGRAVRDDDNMCGNSEKQYPFSVWPKGALDFGGWTISLSTSHVNSAIARGTDSLSPHDSAACDFLSDMVRVFRVIIIVRFHSSYRHNHQQNVFRAASNDFFVLNFVNLIWEQFHRQKEDDKFNDRLQSISKILRWVCSFRNEKKTKKKKKTTFIPQNENNILRELWHWHDTIQHYCDSSLNFVAQIGWEVTERKSINWLENYESRQQRGGNKQSQHKIQFYWNGSFFTNSKNHI